MPECFQVVASVGHQSNGCAAVGIGSPSANVVEVRAPRLPLPTLFRRTSPSRCAPESKLPHCRGRAFAAAISRPRARMGGYTTPGPPKAGSDRRRPPCSAVPLSPTASPLARTGRGRTLQERAGSWGASATRRSSSPRFGVRSGCSLCWLPCGRTRRSSGRADNAGTPLNFDVRHRIHAQRFSRRPHHHPPPRIAARPRDARIGTQRGLGRYGLLTATLWNCVLTSALRTLSSSMRRAVLRRNVSVQRNA